MSLRLVVTGSKGQLAQSLLSVSQEFSGVDVTTLGRPQLDLESPEGIASALAATKPDLVVNAAAFTAVDLAEAEAGRAFKVNATGAGAVAKAAEQLGVPLIHISTDYVFAGDKREPYVETDPTGPINTYGFSKLAGEVAVREAHRDATILRTSWIYSPFGHNFVRTMLRLGRERPEIRVVNDQHGNPTSALDLARAICQLARQTMPPKTFHIAGGGSCSWFEFSDAIFNSTSEPHPKLHAIGSIDYPTPARRPANSRLNTSAMREELGIGLRDWREGLHETLSRLRTVR